MAVSGVSDLTGRVLAGRYRLLAPIGTGASGRVYRAEDTRLRRSLAVKVLHLALAEDAGFLRRFRAEAQLAASLSHPHVMTVYDWGEDDVPFMAVELLEGGSLRAMLDAGNLLSPGQAARIGRDVARALEYAHSRGIVHRDIKPANLLFDEHGIVRVADFGLARALAEASWTEPSGAVLGTARYASPEQALGSPVDARSDLYSLALVLVEAVTGRVPFAGDTTVGTLAARTQRSIVAPDEMGPLKPVVERAGRIDPAERYADAATMASALSDAAEALPRPAPLVLAGMADRADDDPTRTVGAAPRLFDQDAVSTPPGPPPLPATTRRLVPFVVAFLVVAVLASGVAVLVRGTGATASVPGVVGYDRETAQSIAQREGLRLVVARQVNSDEPAGTVLQQDPASGRWTTGGTVRVVVSRGPPLVRVPDMRGMPLADAWKALQRAGLVAGENRETYSDQIDKGAVVSSDPEAGTAVRPDSRIVLTLSAGPRPVPIPDVAELSYDAAVARLSNAGFVPERVDEFSDTVDKGRVVATRPAIGEAVQPGATVQVVVSRGPDLVRVPDVVGMRLDAASERLDATGLVATVRGAVRPRWVVVSQTPRGGQQVKRGSEVSLVLGPG
jgi:beta-lactam-binding protein with PASTA domain